MNSLKPLPKFSLRTNTKTYTEHRIPTTSKMWCPRLLSRHREVSKPREGLCYGALATWGFVFKNSIYDIKLYRSPGQVGCVVEGGGCEGRELALFQAIRWGSHPLVNYPSTLPPSPCGSLYFSSIYLYACNILVWLRMFVIWMRLTRW